MIVFDYQCTVRSPVISREGMWGNDQCIHCSHSWTDNTKTMMPLAKGVSYNNIDI